MDKLKNNPPIIKYTNILEQEVLLLDEESRYRQLYAMILESDGDEGTSNIELEHNVAFVLNMLSAAKQMSPSQVVAEALRLICERNAVDSKYSFDSLHKSVESINKSIDELDTTINDISKHAAIGVYGTASLSPELEDSETTKKEGTENA